MDRIVNILIAMLFTVATGYTANKLIFEVKKTALTRVKDGLSSSEEFAQQLTDFRLPF